MGKADNKSALLNNRTICLPFSQEDYIPTVDDPLDFRKYVDDQIELFSELFVTGHYK